MTFTWLITKAQPHADGLVIQLRREGLAALALPCIEHQWRDWPDLATTATNPATLLFVTSRAVAARIDVPDKTLVAALEPVTAATLAARGIQARIRARGGVQALAEAVVNSRLIADGGNVFYPTSEAALHQPEHLAAVARLQSRLRVTSHAVYHTVSPARLAAGLAALRDTRAAERPPAAFAFWSPSAIDNFAAAGGFELPPTVTVLVGGSTERAWHERAPTEWRRAYKHDASTPLAWSLRFLERS